MNPSSNEALSSLSALDRRILSLLADGLPYREIADDVGLATKTLKNRMVRLLADLGLPGRRIRAAVLWSLQSVRPAMTTTGPAESSRRYTRLTRADPHTSQLSARELRTVELVACGFHSEEIALRLEMPLGTVRHLSATAQAKMGLKGQRLRAAVYVAQMAAQAGHTLDASPLPWP